MNRKFLHFAFFTFLLLLVSFPAIAENSTILNVEYNPFGKIIDIKSNRKLTPQVLKIDNPPRIVMDFPSTSFNHTMRTIDVNDGFVKKIRVAQFSKDPLVARVTVELSKHIDYEVRNVVQHQEHRLQLTALEFENNKPAVSINNESIKSHRISEKNKNIPKNSIELIEINPNKVMIAGKDRVDYQISRENLPDIFVIKFPNLSANGIDELPVKDTTKIKSIVVNENDKESVFTFRLTPNHRIEARELSDKKVEFYIVEGTIKDPNANYLTFDFAETEKMSKVYLSTSKRALNYQIFTLSDPERLVIDTYGTSIADLEHFNIKNSSKVVENIRYGILDKDGKNEGGIRVVLDLKKRISVKEQKWGENKTLELQLSDQFDFYPDRKYHVVLDAGHGGKDPGAIGPRGTREKDVTMKVTSYVKELLDQNGIGVILTRSSDDEILLQPRVDVANYNKADLFVSIHCNALDRASPRGIETYYKTPQSLNLAKVMHKALTGNLPTLDRGIRSRNFFVIRKTSMPSVLLEIGYLTNHQEESQLASSAYQKQVAQAIYKGITEYLKTQTKI